MASFPSVMPVVHSVRLLGHSLLSVQVEPFLLVKNLLVHRVPLKRKVRHTGEKTGKWRLLLALPLMLQSVNPGFGKEKCPTLSLQPFLVWLFQTKKLFRDSDGRYFVFIFVWLVFGLFCCTVWPEGSYFPDQGLNPCPLQWKHRFLTTEPPRKSQMAGALKVKKLKRFPSSTVSYLLSDLGKIGKWYSSLTRHINNQI